MDQNQNGSYPTLFGGADWRFSRPETSSSMRMWALSAVMLGVFTCMLSLVGIPCAHAMGDFSLARMDLVEAGTSLFFISGGLSAMAGRGVGLRLLMAVSSAACLMNLFDLLRDLRIENIVLQVIASVYCMGLAAAARREEARRFSW